MYLQPIFDSPDIIKQLPTEGQDVPRSGLEHLQIKTPQEVSGKNPKFFGLSNFEFLLPSQASLFSRLHPVCPVQPSTLEQKN